MDCWGQCKYCGKYGHKSDFCRNKPSEQAGGVSTTTATEIANTAQVKNGKKKKKNKNKLGKAAAEKPEETQQKTADKKEEVPALTESEESDE